MDLVKVRMQTQPEGMARLYSNSFQCMLDIIRKEGPRGFYRGVSAPLLVVTPRPNKSD